MLLLAATPARADPNVPVPDGYRLDDYRAPVPDTVPGAVALDVMALHGLVERGGATLVDVLPAPRRPPAMRPGAPWLPERHETLPGAVWWPEVGRGALPPATEARLRQRLAELAAAAPDRVIVFFCQRDCWMSWNAARRAAAYGFRAGWFPDGVDGWRDAGLPLVAVEPEAVE